MTITATLTTYRFEATPSGLMRAVGSLMWGRSAAVRPVGADLYKVTLSRWMYDPNGELVEDIRETRELHGGEALGWIFAEAPRSFWSHR